MAASLKYPVRLALASAMLAGLSAHAVAAEPFLSATSSLSNLMFQLIDLNPNDGIAPSFTFFLDGQTSINPLDVSIGDLSTTPLISPVPLAGNTAASPLPTVSRNAPFGQVTITPNAVTVSSTVRTENLSKQPFGGTYSYAIGPDLYTVTESGQNIGGGGEVLFTLPGIGEIYDPVNGALVLTSGRLSANTALIIMGQAKLSVLADRSVVEAQAQALGPDNDYVDYGAHILASINIGLSGNNSVFADATSGSFSNTFSLQEDVGVYTGSTTYYDNVQGIYIDTSDLVLNRSTVRDFSLVAFNNSSLDTDVQLDVSLNSTAAQLVNSAKSNTVVTANPDWVPEPPTPTIPEPSTYALMGLGLVGVALAARRQRPTQNV
jgi:hypothetical protein